MNMKPSRMVRVEYFTTLTKLGPGTYQYITSLLISRVCLVKTSQNIQAVELKDAK
jgi:hypothetical protein